MKKKATNGSSVFVNWARLVGLVTLWVLAAPVLLEWGFGAAHPLLDWLGQPGAVLLSLPSVLGVYGLVVVVGLAVAEERSARRTRQVIEGGEPRDHTYREQSRASLHRSMFRVAEAMASLSVLASCLALSRPLSWLALVPLAVFGLVASTETAWALPHRGRPLLVVLCWALCLIVPPGTATVGVGTSLLASASWLTALPSVVRTLLSLVPLVVLAVFFARRAALRRIGLVAGMGSALLLEATFGTPVSLPFAVGLGALLGGWPLPLIRRPEQRGHGPIFLDEPLRIVLPALGVTALVVFGSGMQSRWICPPGDGEYLRFLAKDPGASDVAVVPGNLPFILLLRGEPPARLERLSPTGIVGDSVPLDRPGGRLVSSGALGGEVARLVPSAELPADRTSTPQQGATVEWWLPSTMERVALWPLPSGCDPVAGQMAQNSSDLVVSCSDGRLFSLDRGSGAASAVGDSSLSARAGYSADVLPLRLRSGPLSRFVIETSTMGSAPALGPFGAGAWTGNARITPGGLLLARGPIGQIEVRGEDPLWTVGIGAPESTGAKRRGDEAQHVLDRVRVPGWPDQLLWSPHHAALWVTSRNSGEISLVDTQVTWHRQTVNVGPPPSRVVVDLESGTLFGVNRCGLFTLRIPSIFPWESTGDVEGAALEPAPVVVP